MGQPNSLQLRLFEVAGGLWTAGLNDSAPRCSPSPAASPGFALFAISILLAAYSYKDYGMSWDEPAQHTLGIVTYNYVTQGDPALHTYVDRALGTGFELPLYAMERWLHLEDPSDIYPARHLATHACFLVAVLCGYMLAWRLFHDRFLAIPFFRIRVVPVQYWPVSSEPLRHVPPAGTHAMPPAQRIWALLPQPSIAGDHGAAAGLW
jgi:hypothetical protein